MKRFSIYGFISLFSMILMLTLIPRGWAADNDSDSSEQSTPGLNTNVNYLAAKKAIANEDYRKAVPLLKKADQDFENHADVLNLLGYSYRKMKDFELALQYYQRALQIEPEHRGANEYLGELYLETRKLAKAEERLQVLDKVCIFGCEEYDDLREAIATYKKKHGN